MGNILNKVSKDEVEGRVFNIRENSKGLWGRMEVNGMLCHTADLIRIATGEKSCPSMSNFITRTIVKSLVLSGMPFPKGKLDTAAELDVEKDGTKPAGFKEDQQNLIDIIGIFTGIDEKEELPPHPVFGQMSKKQWGRLIYLHLDYHFRQFGA